MLKWLACIAFIVRSKILRNSKVALSCYIKNPAHIELGRRVKIHGGCSLDASSTGKLEINDNVTLNRQVHINASRKGVRIGAHSSINHLTVINGAGGVIIGTNVLIGPNVQIISYQHIYDDPDRRIDEQGFHYEAIVIEDGVWVGASAVILAGVRVGRGSVIGAGSVVTKSCASYSVMGGVPARLIKMRNEKTPDEALS